MSHFGIGIWQPKNVENIGGLFRSAFAFGANYIFTIGRKYKHQSTDTCKSYNQIPLFRFEDFESFFKSLPKESMLVGVETVQSIDCPKFNHPKNCCYILGSEAQTLPDYVLQKCRYVVRIPTSICLNVATAGSIILYDRIAKSY